MGRMGAMWECPDCGRTFAARRQVHTCRALGSLDAHLEGVEPAVRAAFEAFVAAVETCGPVEILPQATRIAFHARMSFAVVVPRRRWLNGHLVLDEVVDDPRFRRVTAYSPRNHVHEFRLDGPQAVDSRMRSLIAKAYRVGVQDHHDNG